MKENHSIILYKILFNIYIIKKVIIVRGNFTCLLIFLHHILNRDISYLLIPYNEHCPTTAVLYRDDNGAVFFGYPSRLTSPLMR